MNHIILLLLIASVVSCASQGVKLYTDAGPVSYGEWAQSNRNKEYASKPHSSVTQAGSSLFLLNHNESPHIHREHDLFLTLLNGHASVHFEQEAFELRPGDSVIIPKGKVHWLKKLGNSAAVFNIISAPLEWNDDYHEVK